MNRPGKKDIKAAVDALKTENQKSGKGSDGSNFGAGPLSEKKTSKRIRKQGV